MDNFEIFSGENCYICSEFMGSFKSELTTVTGYSEKPIYQVIETFLSVELNEEIVNEAGVCQNCFIKFNEYDEHLAAAEQIQFELISLMDNKYVVNEEEDESLTRLKLEEEEVSTDAIEYEPFEAEEMYLPPQNEDEEEEVEAPIVETIEEDFHYEIVVDDTKENAKLMKATSTNHPREVRVKSERNEFIVIETDDNQKVYQCDICFKTCKDKSKLRSHREIHTDERNVICPICNKAFKTMNCLRNHKRLHVPERTYYNCDQCDKKYTQKVQLKKHIEIVHMCRRDYVCTTCGASFGTNSVLKMHLLSHQEFRAEKCEVCGFRFHTKAKLRRHMKSHTGERNYECSVCFKKFLYSYNVVAHIRNVHDKKAGFLSCSYCPETFTKTYKLNEHLKQVHQIYNLKEEIIEETLYEFDEKCN